MKLLGTLPVTLGIFVSTLLTTEPLHADAWKTRTTLTGYDLRAIEHALPELRRRRPEWSDYEISVIETDVSLLVSFWRPEDAGSITITRPEPNGGPTQIVGAMSRAHDQLVVELDRNTFRTIRVTNVK